MSKHLRTPYAATATPEVIGYNRRGLPIYSVAGGDQRADLLARRDSIAERLADPNLSAEDTDALVAEATEVREAIAEMNTRTAAADEARAALLGAEPVERRTPAATPPGRPAGGAQAQDRAQAPESIARRVLGSESFAGLRSRGFSGQAAVDLDVDLRGLVQAAQQRALVTTGDTGWGADGTVTRVPDRILSPDRPIRLLDLIDRRGVNTNSVEYVQEGTSTSNAAETAEGALKPESTWTLTEATAPIRTVAHWTNITRQAADDDAQMVAYIEGRLTYGLEDRLERQVLGGNGTAPNLSGILNTAGRQTYTAKSGEAAVLSIRKAITLGQTSEYPPDTVVLNPVDWERIEISTDSNGMFRVSPNVANSMAPRIWGLAVVPSNLLTGTVADPDGGGALTGTKGTAIVGGFRQGATLWERQGIRILMTDSHASNFTSNILTLLAEMRAGLSVWRPAAFVEVKFDEMGDGAGNLL